jgi:purine-nucleoside phosphorylase
MRADQFELKIQESADFVRRKWRRAPRFALILGTGAGQVADQIDSDVILPYSEIPHFPISTALGHKGQLVCGNLLGKPVIAMQGRFHLYEGYRFEAATFPIHVLHRLGIDTLLITNASGGINPNFSSGEIMVIDSHIDLMFRSSQFYFNRLSEIRPSLAAECYEPSLIEQAVACGRRLGFPVHRGVYAALLGPNYESRAEYRFLKRIGADVVGMSTVPEVTVASGCRIKVLGLSIVANIAKPDVLEPTSGQEVIDLAQSAGPQLQAILLDAIEHS